jgi:hypothetical protein
MVFSLVMRKHRQIQATQNRRKKALAFFLDSARVGIVTSLLLQFQFLEGPPPGGFSLFRS